MRTTIYITLLALLACGCGGKVYKNFCPKTVGGKEAAQTLDQLTLADGYYFNLRIVSTFKIVEHSENDKKADIKYSVHEEVPVRMLSNASDTSITFVDGTQEEFSQGGKQIGRDQIIDNIVLWLGKNDDTCPDHRSGPVLYMTTMRIFPVGQWDTNKHERQLERNNRRIISKEYKQEQGTKRYTELIAKRAELNDSTTYRYNKRSRYLRELIANDKEVDLVQMDRFYTGMWHCMPGSDSLVICLQAEEDEGSGWFEIHCRLSGRGTDKDHIDLATTDSITFVSLSNPVTDQLTVKMAVQTTSIELAEVTEVLQPNQKSGDITFVATPGRTTVLRYGNRSQFKGKKPKDLDALKNSISTITVYARPDGTPTLQFAGTNATGKEVKYILKKKKARQRVINREEVMAVFDKLEGGCNHAKPAGK